jgi:hypothetical protein
VNLVLPVGGEWCRYDDADIAKMSEPERRLVDQRDMDRRLNPLSCFLPHGVAWHREEKVYAGGRIKLSPSEYPKEYGNDGVAFLNDRTSGYAMLLSPRKCGKTTAGAVKMGINILDCDPTWPIFTENGVKWMEFQGPTIAVVASFGMSNLKDLWEVYREFLPRYELGPFAPNWGLYPGEEGPARNINFGDGRPKDVVMQRSRSRIVFLCYTQQQHIWESFKAKFLHADEQIKLNLLRAWEDGSSTFGNDTQAWFTLSGFVLDERPEDTGAAGPLKPIWDGRRRGSKTVGRYNMDIESTPDVILTKEKKRERFDRYVNPDIERSDRDARRGLAVYYPGWEPGGGLLFGPDVWDRDIHLINPLWPDDKVPKDWTKWRVVDYADKKTTCCSWWAVGPECMVLYRLLYETELLVAQTAKRMIEMSHNRQVKVSEERDWESSVTYDRFTEIQDKEQFYVSMLDPRAAQWRKDTFTVIELFRRYGIESMIEASTAWNEVQIPMLKDLLRIDREKPHPFNKGPDGKPLMGAARLYFFDIPCIRPAVDEMESLPEDPAVEGKRVMDVRVAHDFVDTAKYFASDGPRYMGPITNDEKEERYARREATPFTGY